MTGLVLTPRRQPKRMNGQPLRGGGHSHVLVNPVDAEAAGVRDGELIEVVSKVGSIRLTATPDPEESAGRFAISTAEPVPASSAACAWRRVRIALLRLSRYWKSIAASSISANGPPWNPPTVATNACSGAPTSSNTRRTSASFVRSPVWTVSPSAIRPYANEARVSASSTVMCTS